MDFLTKTALDKREKQVFFPINDLGKTQHDAQSDHIAERRRGFFEAELVVIAGPWRDCTSALRV